jgi:hypothetical protein
MDILGITDTVEDEFEYFKERTMHGTCQWLLGRQYFREWAASSSNASGFLWLTGSPGSGKSTWASFAIAWLRQSRYGGTCQHHFFLGGNQHKRTVSYFLRSMTFQVALAYDSFCHAFWSCVKALGSHSASKNHHLSRKRFSKASCSKCL